MGCRLLVLDDDPLVGKTIGHIAASCGFQWRYEGTAESFLRVLDAWKPTHIMLDLVMPDVDGVEVIALLARRGCKARIIVTSGMGGRVLQAAGRTAVEQGLSIAGVLSKPFAAAALRALLNDHSAIAESRKDGGVDGVAVSEPADDKTLAEELSNAIARRELSMVYQPKVRCADRRVSGFEALVRWQHPVRGCIGPAVFVPLSERSGCIGALTEFVLDESLRWFAALTAETAETGRDTGTADMSLSVNVSALTLADPLFVEHVLARCACYGVPPCQVMFELTETAAMDDPVSSLGLLTRLRMKGFALSIDDFGTGFSSMLQLVRMPFSEVKVDRSFISSLAISPESQAVVRSIIDLGHSLGMRVAAEGVEDERTMAWLVEAGCDLAQGFLIARPLLPDAVAGWLASRQGKNVEASMPGLACAT